MRSVCVFQLSCPSIAMKEGETSESRELLVAMATVKDWLLTKGRDAGGLLPSMKDSLRSGLTFAQVVVTPDNIPEFTIPRPTDGGLSPRLSIESQEVAMLTRSRNSLTHSDARSDGKSDTSSPYLSPCGSREASPCLLQPRAPYVSRSAPSSPLKGAERAQGAWEPDDCQATNVDPFSLTAMSLPHLKAVTNFGFETLSEPPHTRRKESLFHDGDLGGGQPLTSRLQRRRVNSADGSRSPNSLSDEDIRPQRKLSWRGPTTAMETDCRLGRKQSSKRRNVPSLVAPLGVVLPQQRRSIGETSNPLLLTTPSGGSRCTSPTPGMGDFARLAGNGRFERGPTRRRSGSLGRDDLRYLSTEHSAGPDTQMGGHILVRRNSCAPNLMDAAHSTKVTYLPTPASNERLQRRFSCQSPPCACVVDTDHLGDIKLSFRHDASTHQLHVTVQRAESLVAPASHKELRPFAKICLLPGKMQKQSTAVVKHTRAPEWNQDLVFRDVNKQQLEDLRVRVKVCSKLPNPRRALCLGEATIALRDLDMDGECTLWKALEPKLDSEVSVIWVIYRLGTTMVDYYHHVDPLQHI